jgi:pentatricopeptide repeat protein
VVKYARQRLKTTIALYSSLTMVYAYSGMYVKACDLYGQILEEGLEPDQMVYNCLMNSLRCATR